MLDACQRLVRHEFFCSSLLLFVGIGYLAFFLPTGSLPIRVTMLLFMLM